VTRGLLVVETSRVDEDFSNSEKRDGVTTLHMGQCFNEIAWGTGSYSHHSVRATAQDATILCIPGDIIRAAAKQHPLMDELLWQAVGGEVAREMVRAHAEEEDAYLAAWQVERVVATLHLHKAGKDASETITFAPRATCVLIAGRAALLDATLLERAAHSQDPLPFEDVEVLLQASGLDRSAGGASDMSRWEIIRVAAKLNSVEEFEAPALIIPHRAQWELFRVRFQAAARFATEETGIFEQPTAKSGIATLVDAVQGHLQLLHQEERAAEAFASREQHRKAKARARSKSISRPEQKKRMTSMRSRHGVRSGFHR